jgi:hypothetical protein
LRLPRLVEDRTFLVAGKRGQIINSHVLSLFR